jgi:hypothetical protein
MESSGSSAGGAFGGIIGLAIAVLMIVAVWRVFTKAGQPGWAAIIPIYNTIILLRVAGKPWWWFLLMLIPLVNIIVLIMTWAGLAANFGKGTGFVIGLIFLSPIFILILAFGSATYRPVGGARSGVPVSA